MLASRLSSDVVTEISDLAAESGQHPYDTSPVCLLHSPSALWRRADPLEADGQPWTTPRAWAEKMNHRDVLAMVKEKERSMINTAPSRWLREHLDLDQLKRQAKDCPTPVVMVNR